MTNLHGRVALTMLGLALLGCEAPPPLTAFQAVPRARLTLDRQVAAVPSAGETSRPDASTEPGPSAGASRDPDAATPTSGPSASPSPAVPTPGGGGRSPSGAAPRQQGRVLGYVGSGSIPTPVAGADVFTTDGRRATTDAVGAFVLDGLWPADGTWMVFHPDFRASTVMGVGPQADLELHVKGDYVPASKRRPSGANNFTVTGLLVDDDGAPLPGIAVSLHAEDGSYGIPVRSDATGRFTMTVVAHDPVVEAASFLAIDYDDRAWMGMSASMRLDGAPGDLDFEPDDGEADPLQLAPMSHTLVLDIDDGGQGLSRHVFLDLALPWGEQVTAFVAETSIPLATAAGLTYTAFVDANTPDRSLQSGFRQEGVVFSSGNTTTLAVDLLRPPVVTAPATPAGPLSTITWDTVAGARGYEVRLEDPARAAFEWEAFTQGTSVPFTLPLGVAAPAGAYDLQVIAWDAAGMAPRQVASLDERRALRILPPVGTYRYAITQTRLAL